MEKIFDQVKKELMEKRKTQANNPSQVYRQSVYLSSNACQQTPTEVPPIPSSKIGSDSPSFTFSDRIERLIDAALADGVLTAKEREVLHKRAAAEGIDPDELDVVIDGRLAKIKREEDWLRPAPPIDKYGDVKKCPNCGEPVEAMAVKCSACGYEFRNVEALKSSQKLAERLDEIEKAYRGQTRIESFFGIKEDVTVNDIIREQVTTIKNFPVPTTKEDLLDFAISMQSKMKSEYNLGMLSYMGKAYKAKYDECVNKAKILFPNDPMFQSIFNQHQVDNQSNKKGCMPFITLAIIVVVSALFVIC